MYCSFPYRHCDSYVANHARYCSFPYRHCDIYVAKNTSFCSFPYRHCDIYVAKNTRFCSFPYRHCDIYVAKDTRFCSFPYRHRINDAKNDAKTTRRPTGGEQRSNPQTPNYKREPFATHSGKKKITQLPVNKFSNGLRAAGCGLVVSVAYAAVKPGPRTLMEHSSQRSCRPWQQPSVRLDVRQSNDSWPVQSRFG